MLAYVYARDTQQQVDIAKDPCQVSDRVCRRFRIDLKSASMSFLLSRYEVEAGPALDWHPHFTMLQRLFAAICINTIRCKMMKAGTTSVGISTSGSTPIGAVVI